MCQGFNAGFGNLAERIFFNAGDSMIKIAPKYTMPVSKGCAYHRVISVDQPYTRVCHSCLINGTPARAFFMHIVLSELPGFCSPSRPTCLTNDPQAADLTAFSQLARLLLFV